MISPILIKVACGLAALILVARAGYAIARRHNVHDELRHENLRKDYNELFKEWELQRDVIALVKKGLADGDEDAVIEFFEKVETLLEDLKNEET